MKKFICALLALCVGLLPCALAEADAAIAAPLVASGEGSAQWVDGTSLLAIEGENGCYIARMDGTPLSEDVYGRTFDYLESGNLVTCAKVGGDGVNNEGALDPSGREVIPFRYGEVKALDAYWAEAYTLREATADNYDFQSIFSDSYYLIDTVDFYALASGSCVATLTRDQYMDARAAGHTLYVQDRDGGAAAYDEEFNLLADGLDSYYTSDYDRLDLDGFYGDGNKYGVKDLDGNVVVEPVYDYLHSFYGAYAEVEIDGRYGLIDGAGNVIVPAEYDSVRRCYRSAAGTSGYVNNGYVCVVRDGRIGYVAAGGAETCEPKYAEDAVDVNGASATYTDIEGNTHLLAADGAECVLEGYEYIFPMDYGGGLYYRVNDASYSYGLIDWHGNVVLPCAFRDISLSGDGEYALAEPDYGSYEIYQLNYPVPVADAPGGEAVEPVAVEPEAEAAAPKDGAGNARALAESAISLLNQDAAANGAAAAALLESAVASLGEGSPAASLLSSALTLLQTDAASNGPAVVTLLQSALEQM